MLTVMNHVTDNMEERRALQVTGDDGQSVLIVLTDEQFDELGDAITAVINDEGDDIEVETDAVVIE